MADSRKTVPDDNEDAPETFAVVDIGSNAVRMVVAQLLDRGGKAAAGADPAVEVLERMQRPVHLGQDTFVAGRLSQDTMNAAVTVLRDYRRVLDTYRVRHVRAVATSAVRETGNADAFLDRVFMAAGLDVEVIEPTEESRLTVGAVLDTVGEALDLSRTDVLIADIGGGSALLSLLHQGEISAVGTYRMGSIRLQEILSTATQPAEQAADVLRHEVSRVVATVATSMPLKRVRCLVAVGGDARFAGGQVGRSMRSDRLRSIGAKEFDRFVADCAAHTADELARTYKLPFAAAETLVPALLAFQALLHATAARKVIVSDVSMREGLLLDLVRSVQGREDEVLLGSTLQSARSIGEKYHYDAAHSLHVSELAVKLFDELAGEHGLGSRCRLLLRVAAILHDVGNYVSTRAHHKHSYYLISNAEVFGLRRDERAIVAHTARYHRRSCPKRTHVDYMALARETRMVVSKLAALLRVADALDHGHAQQVRDVTFERRADEFVIHVRAGTDLILERRSLADRADLFADIFGRGVRVEEAEM